ncbi:MAG TPA: hypothetical protein VJY62_21505 [Bacteroidia bacterium]|nr:hypothetical protein [Bacteroidia bacterium]
MKITKRNLLLAGILVTFFFVQKGYTQENAINTGTMYISTGTIVSDEGSFTTSATGSTENNGDFYLKGDWINDGTYPAGTGKVNFWGTSAQNISGISGTVFYDAIVNKPSNSVTVNIDAEVSNTFTLTNGPVVLNSHKITINNSATTAIAYTNGYLLSEQTDNSGILKWNLASTTGAHVIPFGTAGGTIIPLTLDPTAGTLGYITTSTYPSAPNNTPYPVTPNAVGNMNNSSGTDNSANVVDRFWQIDIEDGYSGTETITFTYAPGEEPANGETGLVSQRYSGGWEAPVPFQSANTAANTVTTPGVTVFGPFTLSQTANPLPLELLAFDAELNKRRQVDLKWTTASETNNSFFTVERSKDLHNIESICSVKGTGNSPVVNEYAETDRTPYSGISYYRLKQTDYNENFSYSDWRTINNSSEDVFDILRTYFHPSANECRVTFTVPENGEVKLNLFNAIGENIFSKKIAAGKGVNIFTFTKNKEFLPGMYHLIMIYHNEMKSLKLMQTN